MQGRHFLRGSGPGRVIRSLVLYSGGIDSSYCMLRLLRETRDLVYAHHVRFQAPTGQAQGKNSETIAAQIRQPLAWMREHLRDFEFSQSQVDLSMFATQARENTSLMFFAAQAAMNYGFTPFDRILLGVNADTDPGWNPDSTAYAWRRTLLVRMLRAVWECDEVPYLYFWTPRPSKRAMFDYLPGELAQCTFSCARPLTDPESAGGLLACGQCPRCEWRARVMRQRAGVAAAAGTATAHTPRRYRHPGVELNKMPVPSYSA